MSEPNEQMGNALAEMLCLKTDKHGLIHTAHGPKTYLGLARAVCDLIAGKSTDWHIRQPK